jgi:hypothetical protein
MRILFFSEPFPVRGRPLDFQWVVGRWLTVSQGLSRLGATPLFAVSDAMKAARPDAAPWLLSPADFGVHPVLPEEPAQLDAEWVRLMTDPDMPIWRPFIEALLERTRPDAVVTWTVNAPLRAATAARGIVLMNQELGPMRPPNPMLYFADPQGVNGGSSLPEVWPVVREQPLTQAQEQELKWLYTEGLAPSPLRREELSRRLGLVPGRRVLAVFLQVPRDSNVLTWSRLRSVEALLELVTEATSPEHHQVLVKPHPLHPVHPRVEARHVRAVPDVPTESLLEVADAVLTINSSVGLEALARGKVVYSFGEGPYTGRGCTRDLGPEPEQLRKALAELPFTLTEEEERLRHRLLHFLVFRYLLPEGELSSPAALLGRLERWRRLGERGAPRVEWFTPEPAGARLSLLQAEKVATEARAQLTATTEALRSTQAHADALSQQLTATTEGLRATQAHADALSQQLTATTEGLRATQAQADALSQQLASTTQALEEARAQADALSQRLVTSEGELARLRASMGFKFLGLTRRIPGLYPGYLRAKRLLERH